MISKLLHFSVSVIVLEVGVCTSSFENTFTLAIPLDVVNRDASGCGKNFVSCFSLTLIGTFKVVVLVLV